MIGQGWLTPDQFWSLHPTELHWLIDARRPRKMYGKGPGAMSEDEVAQIYEETYGDGEEEWL